MLSPFTLHLFATSWCSLRSIPVPIGWLSPVGYVETPYLDEDFRISTGDKGSLFIAARVPMSP
jgi:hypothetical protein